MKKVRKAGRIFNGIYLDYAASTPVAPEVMRLMQSYFSKTFGNPGSLHSFGQEAMAAIDGARETIAKAIHADFREVLFTSGATEANNLALRGIVRGIKYRESRIRNKELRTRNSKTAISNYKFLIPNFRPKVIVSAIEHESILDTAYALEGEGVEVVILPVDKEGMVNLKKLEEELDERTVLVSVMYVNNEIGSLQPIGKIKSVIENWKLSSGGGSASGGKIGNSKAVYPLLHTDAAQAFKYFECDVQKLGVDLMTLSSQKIYGPKGAGALYVRNQELGIRKRESGTGNPESGIRNQESGTQRNGSIIPNSKFLIPFVTGGGQEFGLRSGTENVPAIAGFGNAVALAETKRKEHAKKVGEMKNHFWRELKKIYPKAEVNGNYESGIRNQETTRIAPHILSVYFPTEFAGDFLVKLDMAGIAASSGSACSARSFTPSHVLEALGLSSERVRGSVRFSFGTPTTRREINEALRRMRKILNK